MADPELSLNGLPLLFDLNQQASSFLRQFQPLHDLILQTAAVTEKSNRDNSVGPSHIGLPLPNYPAPPPPRINQLYWPTGAARWARGHFLASKTTALSLAENASTELLFRAVVNDMLLETQLYILPPHPISCVENAETLWLIPVVDERYWWQFRNYGTIGQPNLTTWTALYNAIALQLGIDLTIDTISSSYLSPDSDELTRRYDNAATLLDAVAHSVGQRIVKQFDGTYRAINWDESTEEYDANLASRTPWYQIAGDAYPPSPLPASVTVVFPRLSCGIPDCQRRLYAVTTNYSGTASTVVSTTKTIHSTAWANYDQQGVVTNSSELGSLAGTIASDYYTGAETAYDYTFAGIKEWYFTGFDDHALYSFGSEDESPITCAKTDVFKTGESEYDADTSLSSEFQRLCTTRIQSLPHNFGVDQMLQQGSQNYQEPKGVVGFQIAAGSVLEPGDTASAYPLQWNNTTEEWAPDTDCTVTLSDPFYRNCLMAGERCWARKNCDSGEWDVVGENGLRRTGFSLSQIAGGSSGNVLIYKGPLATFGLATCQRVTSGIAVNACLLPSAATVNAQDTLFLHYHPDHFKWFIVSSKGSSSVEPPRIAFGVLTENVCPQDHTTVFSDIADMVLIDGTRLDPATVNARFRFGCRGETGDKAILLRVTDPDEPESASSSSSSTTACPCELYINLSLTWESDQGPESLTERILLTLNEAGAYEGTGTTSLGNNVTVAVSSDGAQANVTVSIPSTPTYTLIGATNLWTSLCTAWQSDDIDFVILRDGEPINPDDQDSEITLTTANLELECADSIWDVIFVEHKIVSPLMSWFIDAAALKYKGTKRDIAVMYCSDEYEVDLTDITTECPEGQ